MVEAQFTSRAHADVNSDSDNVFESRGEAVTFFP
jgi:hypothetical protein